MRVGITLVVMLGIMIPFSLVSISQEETFGFMMHFMVTRCIPHFLMAFVLFGLMRSVF